MSAPYLCMQTSGSRLRSAAPSPPKASSSSSGSDVSPVRAIVTGMVSNIFKAAGNLSAPDPELTPLWQAIKRIDLNAVK